MESKKQYRLKEDYSDEEMGDLKKGTIFTKSNESSFLGFHYESPEGDLIPAYWIESEEAKQLFELVEQPLEEKGEKELKE